MDELASFIGAVIQADQLGVSVGSILRDPVRYHPGKKKTIYRGGVNESTD